MTILEREMKFRVPRDFDPSGLSGPLGNLVISESNTETLEAVYYDSEDLRLLASGMSLRYRNGWMVKLPQPPDRRDLIQRLEVSIDGEEGEIPTQAYDLIRPALRRANPGPVARLSTDRSVFEVRGAENAVQAEILIDRVVATRTDGRTSTFQEIEVELAGSAPDSLLQPLLDRLDGLGVGEIVTVPKLARALGLHSVPDPPVPVFPLSERATAGEVVAFSLALSARRFLDHVPAVILDEGPEGVHQARVATRRLRSDLRTFRRFLERERTDKLRNDLRSITRLLGAVRDLDVLQMRLVSVIEQVPEPERRAADAILSELTIERDDALTLVIEGFRLESFVSVLDDLIAFCSRPPLTEAAGRSADLTLLKMARKPWRKVKDMVAGLPDQPSPEQLHRLRILVKRARYAAEAVAPVGGDEAEVFADQLSELQDVLGEHQDAVVAGAWLRRREVSQSLAAGELIGLEVARATAAAEGWREIWEVVARPELTDWMTGP
jgi:CHAD domain-containing protein